MMRALIKKNEDMDKAIDRAVERITNHPHASAGLGAFACLSFAALLLASPFIFPEIAPVAAQALIMLLLASGIGLLSKLGVSAFEHYLSA
jgi:hypothetical protein